MIMNLEQLKTNHPKLFRAAVADGVESERSRVSSHVVMGQKSGDLKTAHAAIRSGADLTFEIQAQYLAASMNRADTAERQAESDEAEAATADAETTSDKDTDKFGESVYSLLNDMVGTHSVGA